MPVWFVAQCVDMNPARRRFARQALPPAAGVAVRYRYLEAVGREPPCVVEILVAVASPASRTLHHDRTRLELAHDSVGSRIHRRGILAHISEVAAVGRNENVLIRR